MNHCSTSQKKAAENDFESMAAGAKASNTRAALVPVSKAMTNPTHKMERGRRSRTMNDSFLKDRDDKFASMGTWKITKQVSKDGRTYLRKN